MTKEERARRVDEATGVLDKLFDGGRYLPSMEEVRDAYPWGRKPDEGKIWGGLVKAWRYETRRLADWEKQSG